MTVRHIIAGLSLLILAGCAQGSQSPQNQPATLVPSATFTTNIVHDKTELPTTPTNIPGTKWNNCLEMKFASMSETPSLKGLVLFDNKKGAAYFWDGIDDNNIFLPLQPGGRIVDPSVSPNHHYLLYYDAGTDNNWNLVITDNAANIVWTKKIIPIQNIFGWFDSQRLWLSSAGEGSRPDQFLLINPFNGIQLELKADFPSVEGQIDYRWHIPITVYDFSLTRVVYAGCDKNCPAIPGHSKTGWPVFLYDISSNEVITTLMTKDHFGVTPIWLPDSSAFIIAADIFSQDSKSYEFFLISRDGVIKQLTHLREDFSEVEISRNYSLSPNGHYLAFWIRLQPGPFSDGRLAVLNLQNGNITDYCISGFPFNNLSGLDALHAPIWSPDGTQLAIASRNLQTPGSSQISLIDFIRGIATQINGLNNVDPIGWLLVP